MSTANHLTPTEFAARMGGLSLETLKGWRTRGTGPRFLRISHKVILYPVAEIETWEAARLKSHALG